MIERECNRYHMQTCYNQIMDTYIEFNFTNIDTNNKVSFINIYFNLTTMCKSFPGSFLKKNLLTEFMYDILYQKYYYRPNASNIPLNLKY